MRGAKRAQRRGLDGAARLGHGTSGVEATARRQRPESRHGAADGAQPPITVQARQALDEPARVGVGGGPEDRGHGGLLDRIDGILFAAPVLFGYTKFFL